MSQFDRLKQLRPPLPSRFARAQPLKYLILEDFLERELCEELLLEFPDVPKGELELGTSDVRQWGKSFRQLDTLLSSPELGALLAEIAGMPGLIVDPGYVNAGIRHTRSGAQSITPPARLSGGWECQLGLLINLTPSWKETFGDRALLASARTNVLNRCMLFQARLEQPLTLRPANQDPDTGRAIHAYFFARERRAVPRTGQPPVRKEGELPPVLALRDRFGTATTAYETDLAELTRAIEQRRVRIDHLLRQPETAPFVAAVERSFRDVTAPMPPEELRACLALLRRQDALLEALEPVATAADLALVRALPLLPVDGPLKVLGHEGYWRDHWVSSLCELQLLTTKPIQRIHLRGLVPAELGRRQHLTATVDGTTHHRRMVPGDFEWTLPAVRAAGVPLQLQIATLHAWRPSDSGASPDGRELAWHLVALAAD